MYEQLIYCSESWALRCPRLWPPLQTGITTSEMISLHQNEHEELFIFITMLVRIFFVHVCKISNLYLFAFCPQAASPGPC